MSDDVLLFVLTVVGFLVFILTGRIAIHSEKERFNGGICPICGEKMEYFGTDSQGERGYTCPKWHYCTWVSYKCVDKNWWKT